MVVGGFHQLSVLTVMLTLLTLIGLLRTIRLVSNHPASTILDSLFSRGGSQINSDRLEYVKSLKIKDHNFYNVFDESELYEYFRPERNVRIPFYIWDDDPGLRQFVANTSIPIVSSFLDSSISLYNDLKNSPWRVYVKSQAVIHYVPVDEATMFQKWESQAADKAIELVIGSPEWKQFNGTNFVWISSNYKNEVREHALTNELVANLASPNARKRTLTQVTLFGQVAAAMYMSGNPRMRMCSSGIPYSAASDLRSLSTYPSGSLESYRYPGGLFAHIKRRRPYNMIFFGQADDREAYNDRLALMNSLPGIWEPSVLAIYKGGRVGKRREELHYKNSYFPACSSNSSLSGCKVPQKMFTPSLYSSLLKKSRFGFHLRGDDFSSARLSDIIAAQAIPVIVMKEALDLSVSYQCWIPWKAIAVWIERGAFTLDPKGTIRKSLMRLSSKELRSGTSFSIPEYFKVDD